MSTVGISKEALALLKRAHRAIMVHGAITGTSGSSMTDIATEACREWYQEREVWVDDMLRRIEEIVYFDPPDPPIKK